MLEARVRYLIYYSFYKPQELTKPSIRHYSGITSSFEMIAQGLFLHKRSLIFRMKLLSNRKIQL